MRPALSLLLLLHCAPALAWQIVELNWREAAELQAALQPQLRADEKLSALDNKLIIDASPEREAQLATLARQLDVRPVNLRLEVSQTGSHMQSQSGVQLQGNISLGRIVPGAPGNGVSLSGQQDSRTQSSHSLQSLSLLDGRSGFIQTGISKPLPWLLLTPQGGILRGSNWQDAITGFYVRPRLSGTRVIVELAASQQAFTGQQRSGSQLSTTVEGRLGEWLDVASTGQDEQGRETLLIGHAQGSQSSTQTVRIRVQAQP